MEGATHGIHFKGEKRRTCVTCQGIGDVLSRMALHKACIRGRSIEFHELGARSDLHTSLCIMKVQTQSRKIHGNPIREVARGGVIHERGLVQEEPKALRGHAAGHPHRLLDAKIGHVENGLSL